MTNKEFTELVYDMRRAQKIYFKTRDNEILETSKQLEKQVDQEIQNQLFSKQLNLLESDNL